MRQAGLFGVRTTTQSEADRQNQDTASIMPDKGIVERLHKAQAAT
jgi:hypothetical protein